ncbi:DUF742 domain-containing protein [Streptomyces sp. M19]
MPSYMALSGRAEPTRNTLDTLSLLSSAFEAVPPGLEPPQHRIAELLSGGALSLAEVAAYVRLPIGVVKVLVSDLVDAGHVWRARPSPGRAARIAVSGEGAQWTPCHPR